MGKLLLGTTALAAAATLSANALADVAVSGYYEWRYESRSSNITAKDGTQFASDSEIKFVFSNKTDNGLDVSMKQEFLSDGGDSTVQESAIYISGGFGKIQLGSDDGINDGTIPIASNYFLIKLVLPGHEHPIFHILKTHIFKNIPILYSSLIPNNIKNII